MNNLLDLPMEWSHWCGPHWFWVMPFLFMIMVFVFASKGARRYACGEIAREQYEQIKSDFESSPSPFETGESRDHRSTEQRMGTHQGS